MWCELITHFFIMVRFYRSSKMPSGWREHKKIEKLAILMKRQSILFIVGIGQQNYQSNNNNKSSSSNNNYNNKDSIIM